VQGVGGQEDRRWVVGGIGREGGRNAVHGPGDGKDERVCSAGCAGVVDSAQTPH
jgi:hypothetical protein